MQRFVAVEGLRAWLAWSVVLDHSILAAGLDEQPWLRKLSDIGPISVLVFVIVSGFVITHLILEKKDAYAPYILRRWFRIFPLFAVTCVIGALTMPLYISAANRLSWHPATAGFFQDLIDAQAAHPWAHVIAHLSMLHGAISDTLLPKASVTFMPPAWSLSLEWQFYLLAPLVIVIAKKPVGAMLLLLGCTLGFYLSLHGKFGEFFFVSSFLPRAAPLFAIGIASRFLWPSFAERVPFPSLIAFGAMMFVPGSPPAIIAVLIWISFYAFVCGSKNANRLDTIVLRVFNQTFTNRIALFFGERSYSIYLTHVSVLSLVTYGLAFSGLTRWPFFVLVIISGFAGTAILSIVTYALIEKPGMKLGRTLARKVARVTNQDMIFAPG